MTEWQYLCSILLVFIQSTKPLNPIYLSIYLSIFSFSSWCFYHFLYTSILILKQLNKWFVPFHHSINTYFNKHFKSLQEHIHNDECVLVFGYSSTLEYFLKAAARKRRFQVRFSRSVSYFGVIFFCIFVFLLLALLMSSI